MKICVISLLHIIILAYVFPVTACPHGLEGGVGRVEDSRHHSGVERERERSEDASSLPDTSTEQCSSARIANFDKKVDLHDSSRDCGCYHNLFWEQRSEQKGPANCLAFLPASLVGSPARRRTAQMF